MMYILHGAEGPVPPLNAIPGAVLGFEDWHYAALASARHETRYPFLAPIRITEVDAMRKISECPLDEDPGACILVPKGKSHDRYA